MALLSSVPATAYAGAAEQHVSPSWLGGKCIPGEEYLLQLAVPNFYFQMTMAYAILRHDGVALGKFYFIGAVPIQDA